MMFNRSQFLLFILFVALMLTIGLVTLQDSDSGQDSPAVQGEQLESTHPVVLLTDDSPREVDHVPHGVLAISHPEARGPNATYVGVENCDNCHNGAVTDHYSEWSETRHGVDTLQTQMAQRGYCEQCHTTGFNNLSAGGYDPQEAWNETTPTDNQTVANIKLLGVQCEACHGPGSDHNGDPDEIEAAPTVGESCGQDGRCHGAEGRQVPAWEGSKHADSLNAAGGMVSQPGRSCNKCHVREAFIAELEGEDEFEIKNPIDCALCHDPHNATNEHQLRLPVEGNELCATCHYTETENYEAEPGHTVHHPQQEMNLGVAGADVLGPVGMAGVMCVDCHMYETPTISRNPITNWVEGETHESHAWEPTTWACASCHSNLMAIMPDEAKPDEDVNNTEEQNATIDAWDDWEDDWLDEVEKYDKLIEGWHDSTERLLERVDERLTELDAELTSAEENATAEGYDMEGLMATRDMYNMSLWNYQMVEADGSHGVHNFDYAVLLLSKAYEQAAEAEEMLEMAMVGELDLPPMADAGDTILIELTGVANFDASKSMSLDGTTLTYSWDFDDGTGAGAGVTTTHTYDTVGIYEVTLTVTDEDSETDTDMVTVYVIESFDSATPDLTVLEGEVDALETALATLGADNTALTALADALGVEVDELNASLAGLSGDIDDTDANLLVVDNALGILDNKVTAQETLNQQQSTDIEANTDGDSGGASTGMFVLVLLLALVALAAVGGSFMMLKEELDGLKGGMGSTHSGYDKAESRDEPDGDAGDADEDK